MNAKNNHGTCWVDAGRRLRFIHRRPEKLEFCRKRFKEVLLPNQLAADGSFPQELRRTKPYGYSIFNADAMATLCWILSTPQDNLWEFKLPDGRNMHAGLRVHLSVHQGQIEVAAEARRDVLGILAGALAGAAVRRDRVSRAQISGDMEDAGSKSNQRGSDSQSPDPPSGGLSDRRFTPPPPPSRSAASSLGESWVNWLVYSS